MLKLMKVMLSRLLLFDKLCKEMSVTATGFRHVLVAAALLALVHGLVLRTLYPGVVLQRCGRPHDGLPHVPLYEQQFRCKEDEIREMFEFAKEPSDWRRCAEPTGKINAAPRLDPKRCPSGGPEASYIPAAILTRYDGDSVMNGALMDGSIAAYEYAGFGGATL